MSKDESKVIKLRNDWLNFMAQVLGQLPLEVQPSCARRRFLRLAKPLMEEMEAEQKELRYKYAEKKETGELKVSGGELVFTAENRKKFNKEWTVLGSLEVMIDITPACEKDVQQMHELLVKEAQEFEKGKGKEMNATDFDYVETMKEIAEALKPVKAN